MFKKIDITYLYTVVLALSISFFISSIFYYKYNTISFQKLSFEKNVKKKVINNVDFDFILKTNIFNLQIDKTKETIPVVEKKEEEVENITNETFEGKLIGIVTGKKNFAILYFKNELVLIEPNKTINGITLKKITPNEVIISYNGKNYKLVLEEKKFQKKTSKEKLNFKTEKIKIKKSEAVKQLRDINRFMRDVVIFPYYDKSQFKGYRIARIAPHSILLKAGLKPGDIIVRVNGENIKNPQKLMEIFSKINVLTAINIDIIRNGVNKSIFIELEE